jgi:hypothetical protein
MQGLLQQIFDLPIRASEFIARPGLDLFQNLRIYAQYECLLFRHNQSCIPLKPEILLSATK